MPLETIKDDFKVNMPKVDTEPIKKGIFGFISDFFSVGSSLMKEVVPKTIKIMKDLRK